MQLAQAQRLETHSYHQICGRRAAAQGQGQGRAAATILPLTTRRAAQGRPGFCAGDRSCDSVPVVPGTQLRRLKLWSGHVSLRSANSERGVGVLHEDRQPSVVPLDCVGAAGRRGSCTGLLSATHEDACSGRRPGQWPRHGSEDDRERPEQSPPQDREAARGCRCCVLGAFSLPRSLEPGA